MTDMLPEPAISKWKIQIETEEARLRARAPEVLAKLEALGSPGAIALFLGDQGIQGRRCVSTMCAIAIYLQRELECREIAVGSATFAIWRGCDPSITYELPGPVEEFVARFDADAFPELVTEHLSHPSMMAA